MLLRVLLLAVAILQADPPVETKPGWSAPTIVPGANKWDATTTFWLIQSDDASAQLEVRCEKGKRTSIILISREPLLKMLDDDGELDISESFDGGKLSEGSTRKLGKGFKTITVSDSSGYVKRLLKNEGKAFLVRVSGQGAQVVYNFTLAGGTEARLGGSCVQ